MRRISAKVFVWHQIAATFPSMRRAILPLAMALSIVPALHAGTGRIAVTTIKALYYWSWDHYTGVEFGAPPDFSIFAIPVSEGNLDWNSGQVGTLNPETNKYEFNDLEPGTYRLDYFCYDGFFWHEPPRGLPGFTPLSPDPIINPVDLTVVDNNTTEVTVAVYKLGTLSGCARDAAGNIIPGIVVSAVSVNELPVQYCQTDRWGEYKLQSSFAVRYGHTIKFEDPSGRYFTGYYHGENVRAARQPGWFGATSGEPLATTYLGNTILTAVSSIEGTTHDRNGTGLGGITVQLYRYNASTELYEQVDGTSTSDGTSTAAGSYRFTPLESGDYRLQFSHPQGAYLAEYYDDKADLDSAVTISLAEGEHRTGIDAVVMTPDYASWADGYSLLDNDRLGPGDLDGDGFNNSKEYAFGTSPVSADGGLVTCTQSGSNLVITFLARTSGATYTIETTTQLAQTWSDSGIVADDAADQNNLPANYTRKTATIPISGRAFYRVKAVAN